MVRLGILSLNDIYPGTWFIARFLFKIMAVYDRIKGDINETLTLLKKVEFAKHW